MYLDTELNKAIKAAGQLREYDESIKTLLSQKMILAYILAGAVKEFFSMKPEEIIPYIEGEPEVGTVFAEPGLTNISSKIHGSNTVDTVPNEGYIIYDIKFYVHYPAKAEGKEGEWIKLLMDVEAQKDLYPGYDIVTRGVYYNARQISAQKGTEFENSDYDSIKKVYSIWICLYPPKYCENTIIRYHTKETIIHGKALEDKFRYDLQEVILINLPQKTEEETEPTLNGMLKTLFSSELSKETIQYRLEKIYHIPLNGKLKGEIFNMCNFSEAILERGIERGIEQGRELGREEGIELGKLQLLSLLVEDGKLSLKEAAECVGLSQENFIKKMREE